MGKKYNGFDALKFGFFGQIGRNLGREVYNSAANNKTYVDTSSVDMSQIGVVDANGNFSYHKYRKTSLLEYFFWIVFIGIMPHIFTLIVFGKTCVRLFRRKVRFVSYYECPVYKDDRRRKYGRAFIGEQLVPFNFSKSFDEAEKGVAVDGKQYNPVVGTKLNTLLYVILTVAGLCWSYYTIAKAIEVNKADEQKKYAAIEEMTKWNDSIAIDDFSQDTTRIHYLFPKNEDKSLNNDIVLVKLNDNYYFYVSSLCFCKAELKINCNETIKRVTIEDFNPDIVDADSAFVVNPIGIDEITFNYRYMIEKDLALAIEECDSFAIRADGTIFRFKCK